MAGVAGIQALAILAATDFFQHNSLDRQHSFAIACLSFYTWVKAISAASICFITTVSRDGQDLQSVGVAQMWLSAAETTRALTHVSFQLEVIHMATTEGNLRSHAQLPPTSDLSDFKFELSPITEGRLGVAEPNCVTIKVLCMCCTTPDLPPCPSGGNFVDD